MRKFWLALILALFLCVVWLPACGGWGKNANVSSTAGGANKPVENPNAAKTNVEELGLLINIPYEAEDIVWKGGVNQKKVIAVLRLSAEDSNKVVAESGKAGTPETVSVPVEIWFPEELTAQSDMSGDSALKGTAFPAAIFYQEPFTSGKVIHIDGSNYFVLELTAK